MAELVVPRDLHDVAGVIEHLLLVQVGEGATHPVGVVDVDTEDDGLGEAVRVSEVLRDPLCDPLVALRQYEGAVEVLLCVLLVGDVLTQVIDLAGCGPKAERVDVSRDSDDLVRSQIAVLDALAQRVDVDRIAEVVDVADSSLSPSASPSCRAG